MEWIKITNKNKPITKKKYLCFVPANKYYNKHIDQYDWDGNNFRDIYFVGRNRIVEVTHYIELREPE